jgi:nicotinamide-nucleotide amidase
VGVAESCTGGLVASRLTDVAGSSDYVDRALVVYSNASKVELPGVDPDLIAAHGAVSEPVAVAMAQGLHHGGGADVAVATTGIAGPGGGSPAKPVGTVCIAVAGPAGTVVSTSRFGGERAVVKAMSASTAIDRLRRYLIDAPA